MRLDFVSAVSFALLSQSLWFVSPVGADDAPGEPHTVRRLELDPKLPVAEAASPAALLGALPDGVRVIDLKKIFEESAKYKSRMKELKGEFEASAARVQAERSEIIKLEADLKDVPAGLPEFKELDETIARRKVEWKLNSDKQLKDIRERESRILWETYSEIQDAIRVYCKANGVTMVMQYNSDVPEPTTTSNVTRILGRNILYVDPSRDITPQIQKAIQKQ